MIITIEGVCDLHVFLEYTLGNVRSIDRGHTKAKHAHFLSIIGRSPSGGRVIALTPRGVSIVAVLPSPPPSTPFCWHSILEVIESQIPLNNPSPLIVCSTTLCAFRPPDPFTKRSLVVISITPSFSYPIKHSFSIDAYKRGIHPTKKTKTTFEPDQSY
jgi:hypothetical protein